MLMAPADGVAGALLLLLLVP